MRGKFFAIFSSAFIWLRLAPAVLAVKADEATGCFFKSSPLVAEEGKVALSLGCLTQIVVSVIDIALSFLGAIALLFLLFGAIKFVVSRGDPKAIEGAQKTMTYAVLGVVVVLGSFILLNIISQALGFPNILQQFNLFLKEPEKVGTWVGP